MRNRNDDRVLRHTNKVVADALDRVQGWAKRDRGIAEFNYHAGSMNLAQYHRGKADGYQRACDHLAKELGF